MRFGWVEILLVFLVILVLFGASRLPQLGTSLGSAIRNFKKGFGGAEADEKEPEKKPLPEGTGSTVASSDKASTKQG